MTTRLSIPNFSRLASGASAPTFPGPEEPRRYLFERARGTATSPLPRADRALFTADSTMSVAEEAAIAAMIPRLLGPVVIAVILNSFAYGICTIEFFQYRLSKYRDPAYLRYVACCTSVGDASDVPDDHARVRRLLVHWTFFVDTVHYAAVIYMLWDYGVANFMNTSVLVAAPWPFTATPIWTGAHEAR